MFLVRRARWLAPVLAFAAVGCGRNDGRVATHPVRGQVFVNGQPAPSARVVLAPAKPMAGPNPPPNPSATVRDDGTFEVTTFETNDGAPAGQYTVLVDWPHRDPNRPREAGHDKLGGKFFNPKTATIKTEVKEGDNVLDPIKIDVKLVAEKPKKPAAKPKS